MGVHSGTHSSCIIHPNDSNGIVFKVFQNHQTIDIPAHISYTKKGNRQTILEHQGAQVLTPEHLLAALYAAGIDHAVIELSGQELPILDGSSLIFSKEIEKAGISAIQSIKNPIVIQSPKSLINGSTMGIILPCDQFKCSYVLDYDHPVIAQQTVSSIINKETFLNQIAPARTFGLRSEYQALLDAGLAKGASEENVLVVGDDDYESNLRLESECAWHKLLDLVGDLSLLGRPIQGHIIGIKTGHEFHHHITRWIHQEYVSSSQI